MDSSIETNGSCVSRSLRRDLQTMEKEKDRRNFVESDWDQQHGVAHDFQ